MAIEVRLVGVERQQGEPRVVGLGDRPPIRTAVDVPDREVLIVAESVISTKGASPTQLIDPVAVVGEQTRQNRLLVLTPRRSAAMIPHACAKR